MRGKNPLTRSAIAGIAFLAIEIYHVFYRHRLTGPGTLSAALIVTFLILYFVQSRLAWFVIPVFGFFMLVSACLQLFWLDPLYRASDRFIAFLVAAGVCLLVAGYGFIVGRRYENYLRHRAS